MASSDQRHRSDATTSAVSRAAALAVGVTALFVASATLAVGAARAAEATSDDEPMPLAADAPEPEQADPSLLAPWLGDWRPMANVEFGVHAQQMKAAGSATFGAQGRGTNTISTPIARLETGIATPVLDAIPGRPRLLLRGGAAFATRETVTIESAQEVNGAELGTNFSVSWKEMWHVGLDARFPVEVLDVPIVIQPGIEYLQSRFRFEPLFTYRAQPTQAETNPPTLDFRGRSGSDVNRMLGPTLSIEGTLVKLGRFGISAYVQGRMYWLLGDRTTAVAFSAPLLNQQQSATSHMEANVIAGQVGFGLRGSF